MREPPLRFSLLLRLAAAVLIVVGIAVLGPAAAAHLHSFERWILDLGLWGVLAYVGVFLVLTAVFVPDTLLALVAGAVYGVGWGVLIVSIAGILAAALQYALARTFLRDRVDRVVSTRPRLAGIQRAARHDQVRLQWLLRLTPFNPTTVSYLLGATGVRFPTYLLACLGLVPAFVVEVYVGYAGRDLTSAAQRQEAVGSWHDVWMIVGLVAALLVLAVLARAAQRAVREAVAACRGPTQQGHPTLGETGTR